MSAVAELARLGLTAADVARLNRELVKDKSYELTPLGQEVKAYLRIKRKRLTDSSHRDYERGLARFAKFFADLELADFEPPVGTRRLEEFLDDAYGAGSPRNYNKNLSILCDFFKHATLRDLLLGDPTRAVERARARDVYRTTFNNDQRRAILASQEDRRDRLALRLLLDYGLRKGALKAVQVKHFDHWRKRLTIFTKGQKVREVPIPDAAFWTDLEQHILEAQSKPGDFLMCRQRTIPVGKPDDHGRRRTETRRFPDKPMSDHGLHRWWYGCLARAGVTVEGQLSGEHMHKARHTAGQRVLDATGNLKAVQKLLGHASISTTGDIYADWDAEQLAATMAQVLSLEEES